MNQQHLEEEPADVQLQRMVKLSQKISNVCDGETMMTVQGALAHLLVQLILTGNANNLDNIDNSIDLLAKAMKADVRVLLQAHRQGAH